MLNKSGTCKVKNATNTFQLQTSDRYVACMHLNSESVLKQKSSSPKVAGQSKSMNYTSVRQADGCDLATDTIHKALKTSW